MSFPAATQTIWPHQKFEGHSVRLSGVIHLPDGQRIITCSYDGSLRVWSLESETQIGEDWRDGESAVIVIALSPDGKKVVSGSGDGALRLWDIDTGKIITKWTGHAGSVNSLCWNREGGRVVSGSFDGMAKVWDVDNGENFLNVGPIETGLPTVEAVTYSPCETMIATGSISLEKEFIKIWDAQEGILITSLKGHRYTVTCLAWAANGRTLISGSLDDSIRTWNTSTWQQMAVLTGHTSGVYAIVISSNGILASTSIDGTARLWCLENGQPIGLPLHHHDANLVSCVSFSADGNLLATGCDDKNAYSWDISVIGREPCLNKLIPSPNENNKSLLDVDTMRRLGRRVENARRSPSASFIDHSPHHPHPSGTRSPPPSSAGKHRAPRPTLLEYASTLFRRNRTKDSNECPALSSQMGEIPAPTYNDDDAPLCSVCSTLDLRAMLHDGVLQERALPLGLLTDILGKHDRCGLCRLIAIVIRRNWYLDKKPDIDIAGITCALYADACGDLNIPGGVSPVRRDLCHRLRIQTSDRPEEVAAAIVVAQSSLLLEIQLLEEDASKFGRTKGLHGRRVSQTVDIGLLKRWIHTCENEHRERCEVVWWRDAGEVLPKCVRVLDVTRMAIVPAPRSCRYVALSYIWGGRGEDYWTTRANVKQRSKRGGLHISVLPVTIRDTIQLVRQLGERYLWIDALCIVQDDLADNAAQIGVMDLVYGNSVFTVFAAGGTSVRDPLPGIRPGTRNLKQEIIQIKGLHLAVPFVLPGAVMVGSEWNTRGWTYQELMLSRRRICFTSHQMHFECMADIFGEDIIAERINSPWLSHPLKYSSLGKFMQRGVVRPRSQSVERLRQSICEPEYMTMVETYTLRRLTRESDIMNAFTALINAMTKGYHWAGGDPGKAFRFGIPLGDLELALVWQPVANACHERRLPADGDVTAWPSWSWAAWRGAVRYDGYGGEMLAKEHARSPPSVQQSLVEQWNIVDDDGKLVRLDVRRTGRKGDGVHWGLYVPPNGDIDAGQLVRENALLQPGTLVFRTSSARFNVTKAEGFIDADVEAKYAIYSILSDIPQPSTRVGCVVLPCSTHSPTSCEFIVLSRTSGRPGLFNEDRLDENRIWKRLGYHGCMFYVMAVQKMQNEERLERLGVGVIFDRAWLNSAAEQKTVFLG